MAEITDPYMYETIRRAVMGPDAGPITLVPAPTNVVDMHGKPFHPPGSLARTLSVIDDAFPPVPSDG